MDKLEFIVVNKNNKLLASELLAEYGYYLFEELKLMAGNENFFEELEKFPDSKYRPPHGAFYIIYNHKTPIGCVGLKRFDEDSCELKRMYIREQFRGKGFAKTILAFALDKANLQGYKKVLLDTHLTMAAAVKAYIRAGFVEIPQYCANENPNPVFLAYTF
jgi:GNAT superfamily N-acetyltransferase